VLSLRSAVAVLVASLPLLAPSAASAAQSPDDGDPTTTVVVELAIDVTPEGELSAVAVDGQRARIDDAQDDVLAIVGDGAGVERSDVTPFVTLDVTAAELRALVASDVVADVEPVVGFAAQLDESVPAVGGDVATSAGWDGTGYAVAVIDSGVDRDHVFLAGRVVDEACFTVATSTLGEDCPDGSATQTGRGAAAPCSFHAACFHGTHVAGIAAGAQAASNPGPTQGVAPGAGIVAVQVFSDDGAAGSAFSNDVASALEWVYRNHADDVAAVNMSIGWGAFATTCDSVAGRAITSQIDNLRSVGIPTVVSSGNGGNNASISAPACASSAVSVGATDASGTAVESYSNVAPILSLLAPGSGVVSSAFDVHRPTAHDLWATSDGTSMAAPHVAGAWAALREARDAAGAARDVTAELARLRATGVPIDDVIVQDIPRIDIDAALLPGEPGVVTATSTTGMVRVAWTPPSWVGAPITGYTVSVDGGTPKVFSASARSADIASSGARQVAVAAVAALGSGSAVRASVVPTSTATAPSTTDGGGTTTTAPTVATAPVTGLDEPLRAPGAAVADGLVMTLREGDVVTLPSGAPAGTDIAGGAVTPSGGGAWTVTSAGRVHTSGDARGFGDVAGARLNAPIVGIAPTPTGRGYWLLGRDGGIFTFGDAAFHGSTGAMRLNQPVVGMSSTPSGRGYWLFAGDGGIFTFGDARFFGSTGATRLNAPITTMAATPSGRGYWLLGADGGVFTFGDARFFGSTGGRTDVGRIAAIVPSDDGRGYALIGYDRRIHRFGSATT
jgi:hypothetical protein